MQERLEALRAKRASETTTDTTTKPAALSMKERLDALRASKAAQAPVVPPVAPVATTAPVAPKPASGPDRWQNVIPQGVNEAASGVIGLGGVAVDTLLNAPRAAAAAVLPRSAYESIYGAPPEVPFTAATEFGANVAGSMRTAAEDVFPKPLAQKDYNAAMSASDGSFLGAVKAAWDNKLGAAQEMAQQAVTMATAAPVAGMLPAVAVLEGGAPEQAGAMFDAEWSQGIPQQSAAYKELAAAIGPDEARRVLRTERMQRTSQLQAAAGVAGGALSAKLGGMELEKALSGQASKIAGIGGIAKQAAMEMPEEAIVQFAGNVAAQNTGNPTLDSLQGVAGAAGAGLMMGSGQSTVVAGAQAAASLLAAKRADVKPTIKFDPKINAALKTPANPAGAQSTVGTTTPQTPTTIVPPAASQGATAPVPASTSTLLQQIMTPEQLALHESLQDEAGRMKMLADIKADAEAKRAGWEKAKASMARNAEDRDWLSKNPITSHPMFGEIDKAVRAGATSYRTLAEKVPQISSSVMQAAFKHLESVGAISPYVKGKKREVLSAPTAAPAAAGTIENNIALPVQPSIEPPVQSAIQPAIKDNIVEQEPNVTLPEVGRIIARETEDVNTQAQTPTAPVQTTTQDAGLTPQTKARRAKAKPTTVEAPVTPQEPVAAVPATTPQPDTQNADVAPPVQAQTSVAEAPLPATIGSAAAPEAVNRPTLDTWVASADPEDVDIWKGTHDAHAKRNNVKPEDTYVGQVLRGITPTATPTADDATFAEKMKLSIPTEQPGAAATQVPEDTVPAPTTETAPIVPPAKQAKEPSKSKTVRDLEKKAAERAAAQAKAEQVAKDDATREALKVPSDAELVGAGLSPAEVTLLKKNPEQHRDVLDAVSRGEISTKEGMRPVTDADVAAAKTRPEKDKLQRLKDKYEQATDAPRKLSPASITNVRKEAIARAYERIKVIAQSPNMGQFDAIPNDPESTKAILGLQAEAQKTPTTEAELAKKLEDQYVENYTRNHPEAKEAAASPVAVDMPGFATSVDIGAALRSIADTLSGKQTTPPAAPAPTTAADYDPLVTDTPSVFSQWHDRGMSLFRNRGNASPDAQAFIEGKAGLESAMLLEAEFAVEHVQRALAEANKGITKATRDIYNVNLLKYLKGDKTATLPAPVVTRLEALRKLIDDRSLALIALGLIPKDKIATVLENHGKWLHRDYQVFQLQPGRNNKPGVYKEHHIALAKDGRRHIVKENIEAAKIDMRLPSIADITALAKDAKSTTSPTAEGAKAQLLLWAWRWQLNTEKLDGKDGVVALLKQKAKGEVETGKFIDPEELLHKQAYDYLMAMLDPQFENSPIDTRQEKFNPRHGVYVDDTAISEDRTPMPQWLRNVWGEYKRWDTVSLLTLETQAKIISKFVSLSNYKTRLEIAGTIFKATDPRSKKGYALLANKIYGPLNGYYIPEKDLWLIQSANTVSAVDAALGSRELSTNPFLGKIMEVTRNAVGVTAPFGRALKVMQVLASHVTAGINAFSTAVQLSGALTRPIKSARNIGKSMKLATSSSFAGVSLLGGLIGGALESNTALHKQLLFLTSKNVLHDSVLAADTRRQYKDQLTAEITSMMSNGEWSWNVTKKAIPWAVDRLSRFNSYGDELGKHIAWAARVEELKDIYPAMSEEEVWTVAAKHVVATMPSYMHAMPLSRAVGASGVLGAYATFHTEVIRNIYNSMEMATEFAAMGSKEARIYAARELASVGIRVAGVATLNSVIWGPLLAAANAVAGLIPGDDDEEEKKKIEAQREAAMKFNTGEGYAAIRPAMADYVQGHQRFLRVTEDGKVLFTNLQRFDPFIFGAMLEAAQYGDAEDFGNIVKSTYADLVGSIPALAGLVGGAAGIYKHDAGTTRNAAAHDMWSAAVEEMGVIYTPGSLKTALRTSKAAEQGVELTPDEKLMDQTGLTIQIFDPKRAASTIAADYDNTHSRSMRLVREQMKEEAETLDFHSATVSKFTIWERAQRKMNNLRKTGLLDEGAIYTAVKSAPMSEGITEAEMVGLVEGMFVLPKYSEQVEKFHKEALVKAGTDQAKLDKVNTLYQTYYKQAAEADKAERAIYKAMGVTVL